MRFNNCMKWSLIALIVMITQSVAHASLLLEPHLGYNISGSGDTGSGTSLVKYSYSGVQLGGRVGYQLLGLMTGVDYTRSSYTLEAKGLSSTTNTDLDRSEIGVFVGYNFPILLRAWGTYYFNNTSTYPNGNEASGNTTELGVGFTGLPFVSLNLMVRMASFDELKSGTTTSAISPKQDFTEVVVGVSLPFTL